MENKVIIKKSSDADSRTASKTVTKNQLIENTNLHIEDVNNVGTMLVNMFLLQISKHDHTKLDYIDEFYDNFVRSLNGENFKDLDWWQIHKTERHHLNDSVPEDVNLLDVLEMVVDCTVAGLARSGDVYPITIPQEVIEKAIENTKNLIINNVDVVDDIDGE